MVVTRGPNRGELVTPGEDGPLENWCVHPNREPLFGIWPVLNSGGGETVGKICRQVGEI